MTILRALTLLALLAVGLTLSLAPLHAMAPEPTFAEDARFTEANAHIEDGRYAEAIELLNQLLDETPDQSVYWTQLAFATRKLGQGSEGETYYLKALELNPENRRARAYLGELYLELGQPADARDQLVELRRLCPQGCAELSELERAFAAQGVALD